MSRGEVCRWVWRTDDGRTTLLCGAGHAGLVLSAKQTMNAIAQHRALANEKTALAEHLLDLSGLPTDDMHAGD